MHPVQSENSDVYAIMPMTTKVIDSLMTFKNSGIFLSETWPQSVLMFRSLGDSGATPENGDNAIVQPVQPGDQAKFQWTIIQVPTDSTGDYYT